MARRLAALMFTDMVGYSALAHQNEPLSRELVDEQRALIRSLLPLHGGQENQTTGDGFFIEFGSVLDAVECAIEIQNALHEREFHVPKERAIRIRIGIHLSDVLWNNPEGDAAKHDLYGDGINIAARIEALAPSGGVCLTRQVFDQVDGRTPLRIRKIGQTPLKNISGGAELYHIVFPWDEPQTSFLPRLVESWKARYRRASANSLLLSGLFAGCVTILCVAATLTWKGFATSPGDASRSPASLSILNASTPAARRLDLSRDWSYALDEGGRSPDGLPSPPSHWRNFDPRNAWKYSDAIHGRYWLKKTFEIRYPFEYPAIVLGTITDSHRVYLNGRFIGGSDKRGDLAYYVFDPGLLNLDGPNTLLIAAKTRPTLDPALSWSPEIGTFMGEFADVKQTVIRNEIQSQVLRSVYLALSAVIFAACFGFALFRRSNRHYLYCSLFLLLGTMYLSYFNSWVGSILDYSFLRYLRAISLALEPFVLCSAYLHLKRNPKLETLNNGAALGVAMAITVALLLRAHTPSSFMSAYNGVIGFALGYAFLWVAIALGQRAREALTAGPRPRSETADAPSGARFMEAMALGFGLLCVVSLLGAYRLLPAMNVPVHVKDALETWAMAMPFVFSLFILYAATVDYTFQSRTVSRKKSRDQLVLSLVRLINGSTDITETVGAVQERVARFLKARRSTLYVLEGENQTSTLKASFVLGDDQAQHFVRRAVRPDRGPLGYACSRRSPLLIQDIRADARFASQLSSREGSGYHTGSCMLFPLVSGDRLVGALTFADKEGGHAFTRDDFAMALEVATDLSLLLDNRQLQESLKKLPG